MCQLLCGTHLAEDMTEGQESGLVHFLRYLGARIADHNDAEATVGGLSGREADTDCSGQAANSE
jgi:hypothetical protein